MYEIDNKEMKDNEQQRGYDIEQGSVDDGERNGEGGDAKEIESCTDMQQIRVNVATGVALYAPIGASDFPHRNENEIEHAGKEKPVHQVECHTDVEALARKQSHEAGEENEHIARNAYYKVSPEHLTATLKIEHGIGNEENDRNIEQNVEHCTHVVATGTQIEHHLQKKVQEKQGKA